MFPKKKYEKREKMCIFAILNELMIKNNYISLQNNPKRIIC